MGYADLLLTRLGIKYLLIETKRPGSLAWSRRAVEAALDQARRYASEQKVHSIAVSDGMMLYAADLEPGGMTDRVFVSLDGGDAPEALWWLSVHGIYRAPVADHGARLRLLPEHADEGEGPAAVASPELLHPKYQLPASCFAYVSEPGQPATWKLPYQLPASCFAYVSEVGEVLLHLGQAATQAGRMPSQAPGTAEVYRQLEAVLDQLGQVLDPSV